MGMEVGVGIGVFEIFFKEDVGCLFKILYVLGLVVNFLRFFFLIFFIDLFVIIWCVDNNFLSDFNIIEVFFKSGICLIYKFFLEYIMC